ncbi:hypothetical protein Taro_050888 [Colocasia esculenta]|uniref:Fe2OG dioxygenase domain-containing protein n=1 Tax=Colocasia esculenta TaxID=4460 RepID=A0A843XEJ7_COLES|nr:hypothetical protein [Colocasia esculenta]
MASFKVAASSASCYDRAREVKEFDESKAGVKGLVDAGVTTIPRFFHHPDSSLTLPPVASLSIPTIDLSLPRPRAVELVAAAARDWGFFQVIDHGLPPDAISAVLSSIQAFHELPAEAKAAHYTREEVGGVSFNSNFDLYRSEAATWRDTLLVRMRPTPPDTEKIPEVCRWELLAWDEHARGLAVRVLGLLSEGLGVEAGRLEGLSILKGNSIVCHYYPYCPQAELTLGLAGHTDPGVLTVLVQNEVGGLLMKKGSPGEGGDWVGVDPVPGAVVINIGNTLQMISNDEYKSVEHKVVANPHKKPRVSIAAFYTPNHIDESTYFGPLPELVSPEKPARYREFTISDVRNTFLATKLGTTSTLNHFKIIRNE